MLSLPCFALVAVIGSVITPQNSSAVIDTKDYMVYASGQSITFDAMIDQLGKTDVVFVGENHDDKHAHELELAILEGLYRRDSTLTLSLEMFERDVQGVVDEYLQDFITETHFLQSSRPWTNYKDDYRPLIEFCKTHRLPVIAANAPRRYVNLVSRKGQAALLALPSGSKGYLAPLPYTMDLPAGYDRQLDEIFGGPHTDQAGKSGPSVSATTPPPSYMKQAQGLWDATMADSLARTMRYYPGRKILQINGAMHSDSGYGIVDRLRRSHRRIKALIISIKPDPDFAAAPPDRYAGIADFLILTRPASKL